MNLASIAVAVAAFTIVPLAHANLTVAGAAPCTTRIALPPLTGKHAVGVSTFFWLDENRAESATADADDRRQVIVDVWYPATPRSGASTVPYAPELAWMRAGLMARGRKETSETATTIASYACVTTRAHADATAAATPRTLPVLIFSPGGNMSRHWHSAQAEEWASHGYVVAVMSHAHSGMDVFPGGGLLMSSDVWAAPKDATPEQSRERDDAMSEVLGGDARFTLSQFEQIQSGAISHVLKGRLDLDRVALLGHSRGGKTVARGCAGDPRFKACVTYDNIAPPRERTTGLRTPQLVVRTAWPEKRQGELHAYLALNPLGAFDAVIEKTNHFTFSDLTLIDAAHYPSEGDALTLWSSANALTLEFLDAALNGRAFRADDFQREHSGIQIRTFPAHERLTP